MLWVVFIILVTIWLLGLITAFTFGGFIHLVLVIAFTVLLAHFLNRRRTI